MSNYDIILDTNIIFSALYSSKGASFQIVSTIGKSDFSVHISVPLILEYEEKLKEKRKLLGLTLSDIDDVIDYLCSVCIQHYEIDVFWRPCLNDPDDEMVLESDIACQEIGAKIIKSSMEKAGTYYCNHVNMSAKTVTKLVWDH